jgi:hypothetical protein
MINTTNLSWQKDARQITRIATDERLEFQTLSLPIRVIRGSFVLASRQHICFPVDPGRIRRQSPAHS